MNKSSETRLIDGQMIKWLHVQMVKGPNDQMFQRLDKQMDKWRNSQTGKWSSGPYQKIIKLEKVPNKIILF